MIFIRRYVLETAIVVALIAVLLYGYRLNVPPQAAAPLATPTTVVDLRGGPIASTTMYAVDSVTIGGVTRSGAGRPSTLEVPPGAAVDIAGWAVDAPDGDAARAVGGAFGTSTVVAFSYGGARPDVAQAFHNPNYAASGFAGHISPGFIQPGHYAFTLDVVAAKRTGFYRLVTPIKFIFR